MSHKTAFRAKNNSKALRFEQLEERTMLSVSAGEFSDILAKYPDLNLSANAADYNIIEVTDLSSDVSLKNAVEQAGISSKSDLIVVRTTGSSDTLTLGGTELGVDINSTVSGSLCIIGYGEKSLKIDAAAKSRVLKVAGNSELSLGGLVLQNGSTDAEGGGVSLEGGTLKIDRSCIRNNSAKMGGGIYQSATGRLTVTNSSIVGNHAVSMSGGGVLQYGVSVTIINSTLAENTAEALGGGIFSFPEKGHVLTMINTTVTGNSAKNGGGGITVFDATVIMNNGIIAGNISSQQSSLNNVFCVDAVLYAKYNLLENIQSEPGLANGVNGNIIGQNAKLREKTIAPDGTVFYTLHNDSPAINAGENSLVSSASGKDQSGSPRIVRGKVDMGSIERNPPSAAIEGAGALSIPEGCSMLVSARNSIDPLGKGLEYHWDFGDGVFREFADDTTWFDGAKIDGKPGAKTKLRLKVLDAEGTDSDIVETDVNVSDVPATFHYSLPAAESLIAGQKADWVFRARDVPGDWIRSWSVNWGDGGQSSGGGSSWNRAGFEHTFASPGQYSIIVTAIDDDGLAFTFTLPVAITAALAPADIPELTAASTPSPAFAANSIAASSGAAALSNLRAAVSDTAKFAFFMESAKNVPYNSTYFRPFSKFIYDIPLPMVATQSSCVIVHQLLKCSSDAGIFEDDFWNDVDTSSEESLPDPFDLQFEIGMCHIDFEAATDFVLLKL